MLDAGEFPGTFVYSAAVFGKSITGIRDHDLHAVYSLYSVF